MIQKLTPKLTDSFTASANIITPSETFSLKFNAWLNDGSKVVNYNNEVTIESNSIFTESLKIIIPNDENLNGMTNTIALSAGLKSTYLITNQETIFLTIQSKNVSFDLEPRCVILTDSRYTDCESKFSASKF